MLMLGGHVLAVAALGMLGLAVVALVLVLLLRRLGVLYLRRLGVLLLWVPEREQQLVWWHNLCRIHAPVHISLQRLCWSSWQARGLATSEFTLG